MLITKKGRLLLERPAFYFELKGDISNFYRETIVILNILDRFKNKYSLYLSCAND